MLFLFFQLGDEIKNLMLVQILYMQLIMQKKQKLKFLVLWVEKMGMPIKKVTSQY